MKELLIVAGIAGLAFLLLKKRGESSELVKVSEKTAAPSAWRGVIYV